MRILQKSCLALSAMVALPFGSAAEVSVEQRKKCLPGSPSVCIGETMVVKPTNDEFVWTHTFVFVDASLNPNWGEASELEAATTGLEVEVTHDGVECGIKVNGSYCNDCSIIGCNWSAESEDFAIKYDCRNLDNGVYTDGQCLSMDPMVYPFELGEEAPIPEGGGSGSEAEDDSEDGGNILTDLMDNLTGSSASTKGGILSWTMVSIALVGGLVSGGW